MTVKELVINGEKHKVEWNIKVFTMKHAEDWWTVQKAIDYFREWKTPILNIAYGSVYRIGAFLCDEVMDDRASFHQCENTPYSSDWVDYLETVDMTIPLSNYQVDVNEWDNIETYATRYTIWWWSGWGGGWWDVTVDSELNASSTNPVENRAIYNAIQDRALDSAVVKLTWNQTIAGTKTFSTSPVVPTKTANAWNYGTRIATEAQVYKKQDTISDLATIRSGASAWATAIQPNDNISELNNDAWYQNSSQVNTAIQSAISQLPTPATVNDWTLTINQNWVSKGTFTANQSGNSTINLTDTTYTAWDGIEIRDWSSRRWPCPVGFHVPHMWDDWRELKDIMDGLNLSTATQWSTYLHIPVTMGVRNTDGTIQSRGDETFLWSCKAFSSSSNDIDGIIFREDNVDWVDDVPPAYWLAIRAFKDEYETPDSTWTVVQWSLWNAWIFWNQSKWLISITDGINWFTIMDKNLWATTVYNNWDTLTEANMGYMYQWWNNYWFPSTWTISNTSSTQVDASSYWPRNNYSSDIFITWHGNWSNVTNTNLRWWETWVVIFDNAIVNTWVTSVNGQTWDVTVDESVVSGDSGVTYTIKVANSDPASWTASNIITLVV